ncbi:MAG: helix-turn-helix transcriptional regulator [Chloroflexi bacterium]|uniref:helix-turn-helix domain-containing protein n=1 Tax=Candidatus Flexifilum breve TaxID=3140694 RepID=UPI0031364AF5|nr:helix-turn-helix transcriptional regulator [Chloroflexota bacterium]
MTQTTTFGTALRAFRQREGIGIFDLAARLGWKGTGPVIELEKGRRLPRPSTIDRLGAALHLTPSDIAYLRGLAGYGNITRLPPKEQIIAVLEAVAEQVHDYQFPLYITDFRGLYWLINENEITLHDTGYSSLEASMRHDLTVFDAIFDSKRSTPSTLTPWLRGCCPQITRISARCGRRSNWNSALTSCCIHSAICSTPASI